MNKIFKLLLSDIKCDQELAGTLLKNRKFRKVRKDLLIVTQYIAVRTGSSFISSYIKPYRILWSRLRSLNLIPKWINKDIYFLRRHHVIRRTKGLLYKQALEAIRRLKNDKY